MNHPMPPTVAERSISPQFKRSFTGHSNADPQNRYANAREFAHDLQHLDQVGVEDRPELRNGTNANRRRPRAVLYYGALALIPVVILLLMILVARHR